MKTSSFLVALLLVASAPAIAAELLLFGGASHDVFLGCLNCSEHDSGSVCNKYGDNGSKYSGMSIWNKYGNFGSKYSDTSPWNKYASNPPVVVDRQGGFYGYMTANKYMDKRTRFKALVLLIDQPDFVTDDPDRARDLFCGK
jgi:hypothetical protein